MLRLITLCVAMLAAALAQSQPYPNKPVHVLAGSAPGNAGDVATRAIAAEFSKRMGQPFVVENRFGAEGVIAATAVKQAEADGYTLYGGSITHLNPVFMKSGVTVGPGKDISPIADFSALPLFWIARSSLGVKTLQDLVAYSKANPGKLNYGSVTTNVDLQLEIIKARTGLTYTAVRYKTNPVPDTLSGIIDFITVGANTAQAHVQSGRLVPLMGSRRQDIFPGVPSSTDLGLPAMPEPRLGLFGPGAMPIAMRQKLAQEIALAVKTPTVTEYWQKVGFVVTPTSPEEQQHEYDAAIVFYKEAAKLANFQPE